jgi:hypothetical protein
MKVDMSSEAVTARLKLTCQLTNFAQALRSARSAAARARVEQPSTKQEPQPKEESSKEEKA